MDLRNSFPVSLLASELYSTHGGVQAYMRRLAEILTEYNQRCGRELDCVSLMDTVPMHERHERSVRYGIFRGASRSKARFTHQAVALGCRRKSSVSVIGHPGLTPVAWLLKRIGLTGRYIVVLHGVEAWVKMHWTDRLVIRGAHSIIATTRFTALEFCKQNRISFSKMRIIPLAVSESDISQIPPAVPISKSKLSVLTVTRMATVDGYKGVDTLIDAVAVLRAHHADVELKVVGTGDEMPRMVERANKMGLNGSVRFLGAVPDEELSRLYRECDVFALPSKGEGFGIVFLEAMRWGKPCIGGNHGGTPEVVIDGETGYLVEYGDSDRLGSCLLNLLENSDLRRIMGAAAYEKVRFNYTYSRMRDEWFSVIDEAMCNRPQ